MVDLDPKIAVPCLLQRQGGRAESTECLQRGPCLLEAQLSTAQRRENMENRMSIWCIMNDLEWHYM